MFRKIWAVVDEKTFANFRDRAVAEGMDLGEAFRALATAYSKGYGFDDGRNGGQLKDYAPSTGIDYVKEHSGRSHV